MTLEAADGERGEGRKGEGGNVACIDFSAESGRGGGGGERSSCATEMLPTSFFNRLVHPCSSPVDGDGGGCLAAEGEPFAPPVNSAQGRMI